MIAIIINMLVGLLTPVIAVVVAYIAYQQHKTDKLKLQIELFNKRFSVYQKVLKILDIVRSKGKLELSDIQGFHASVTEADFLFGPEIREYLDSLCKHGGDLWADTEKYRDIDQPEKVGYDHGKVADGINKESEWLSRQYSNNYELVIKKFKKYLDVNESGIL